MRKSILPKCKIGSAVPCQVLLHWTRSLFVTLVLSPLNFVCSVSPTIVCCICYLLSFNSYQFDLSSFYCFSYIQTYPACFFVRGNCGRLPVHGLCRNLAYSYQVSMVRGALSLRQSLHQVKPMRGYRYSPNRSKVCF